MLQTGFNFIRDTLDQDLRTRFRLREQVVIINNLVDLDGGAPQANQNKVVITLINLEEETNRPYNNYNHRLSDGRYREVQPDQHFNLYLLLSSNFDDYSESLKFLNAVLLFFQAHPSVTSKTNPNLPSGIGKLEFDLENNDYCQTQSLWNCMGAKYRPSAIFKTRLLRIQSDQPSSFPRPISATQVTH